MALAKDTPRASSPAGGGNFQVVNAAVMYLGARAAICTPTHGTTASRGRVSPWTGVAGEFSPGFWRTSKTTGDTAANPIVNGGLVTEDLIVENLAVTALASSAFQADNLKWVYASADGTFTLTRPAAPNRTPVGCVWRGKTASVADVFMFGVTTMALLSACGTTMETICLGAIGAETPSAQNLLTGIVLTGHGKIIDTYAICVHASTDADWTQLVNLEIDTVDVTGGVITTLYSDAQGDKKAGTAITAANEFHDGAVLDVEAATVTAGTANNGLYNLYITVERLLGL